MAVVCDRCDAKLDGGDGEQHHPDGVRLPLRTRTIEGPILLGHLCDTCADVWCKIARDTWDDMRHNAARAREGGGG